MKSVLKNIILIVALAAVIVIVIAILLYDFIPSGKTVAEPNIYTADTETTKVLSEIAESSGSLNPSTNDNGGTQSNVVLRSYSITETDLALYQATGDYEPGRKADPFSPANPSDDTGNSSGNSTTGDTNGGTTGGNSTNTGSGSSSGTTESDGTLFNSTSSK